MTMKRNRYAWKKSAPAEYRWRCGLRSSRWFKSYRAAGNAAVRNGLGWWEGERLVFGPLLQIEERPASTKKAGQA